MTQRIGAIVIVVILMLGKPAATVLIPVDLAQLARDAHAIARGRITLEESRFSDDRRAIETVVTLDVDEYLKGGWGPIVRFVVPGGRLGRYRRIVIGTPEFQVAERVIVFLGARGPSLPYVLGSSQGVFRVVQRNGEWLVTPPPVSGARSNGALVRGDLARRPPALAGFEQQVRALVAAR